MSSNNIDLFSYFPGIEVSANDILEAELLAFQVLKAKFPDIDLRDGTALRDMVIRPNATLLAMINKALLFYFAQNTLSDVTDTTPTVFVDKLMSNWFLNRKQGIKAIINARLYFAKSKTVSLTSDIFFSTDGTLKYSPIASVTYSADQLIFDANANQYYLDVDLQAEQAGTTYNITSGSLIYFSNFDPYFLHAEINYLKNSAENIETNSQFITRSNTAISTRNLINVPSINSNLLSAFPIMTGTLTAGFGDTLMVRDQIQVVVPTVGNNVWIHNGGCVDIYSRLPLASSILQLTADNTGKINLTGSIYKFERSQVSGGTDADTIPTLLRQAITSLSSIGTTATVTVTAANHGYTNGQLVTIEAALPSGYNGTFAITSTGAKTFTYTLATSLTSPATGVITAGIPYAYTASSFNWLTATPTSITRTGAVATVTQADHGLTVGERIKISGADQIEYNGTFVIASVPTKDTYTYAITGTPITATGILVVTFVARMGDVGFSDRQHLVLDFGVGNANLTASFVVYYHQDIDGIQMYLNDEVNRVLCGDYLARGHNLTSLDISINSYNGLAANAALASTTSKAYLDSLFPGQPFVMSDLLSLLYAAGIKTIQTPVTITYTKYWRDNFASTTGTILDVLNPSDSTNIFVLNSLTTTASTI